MPFELTKYLTKEFDEIVWMAIINRAPYVYRMLITTSIYGDYQKYMSSLVQPYYKKLGWTENQSDSWIVKSVLRDDIIAFACFRGLPECLDAAILSFNKWILDENNNT